MINILIGALNATDGEIFLDGTNIKSLGTDYLKLIGFMPQYPKILSPIIKWMNFWNICAA